MILFLEVLIIVVGMRLLRLLRKGMFIKKVLSELLCGFIVVPIVINMKLAMLLYATLLATPPRVASLRTPSIAGIHGLLPRLVALWGSLDFLVSWFTSPTPGNSIVAPRPRVVVTNMVNRATWMLASWPSRTC